jgi:PGF-CTERM protein
MWTQVDIKDSQGREIYSSGNLDKDGNIENGTIYWAVYSDADGNPTLKLWEITDVISDNRIAPESTAIEVHNFTVPEGVVDPIIVDTKLLYRSAPQSLIDELFGGEYEVPIVEMESVKGGINGEVESEGTPGFGSVVGLIALLTIYLFRRKM